LDYLSIDFNDGGRGEKFSDLVDTMTEQLKSEKEIDIEDLKESNPDKYKRYVELFAEQMNLGKRIKTDHCGINFFGRSLNFREFNNTEKIKKIVEKIYQESEQSKDAKDSKEKQSSGQRCCYCPWIWKKGGKNRDSSSLQDSKSGFSQPLLQSSLSIENENSTLECG
jgi:hypothetical protein